MTSKMKVAFLGLGRMGQPMARRLAGKVGELRCFDLDQAAVGRLAVAGAIASASVRQAVKGADLVITMLPDGRIVRNVMLGEEGAASAMHEGAMLVDMSSSAPLGTRELGEALRGHGLAMIDAPVSGGVPRAETGKLAIMAGGEAADVERARPVLELLGSSIIHTGGLGSGHAMKALNNYVSAAGLAAASEALLIAEAYGIRPETVVDALNGSTGRNNSTEVKLKPHILSGSFGSGFALALMSKDINTAADLARDLHCHAGGLKEQARLWAMALADLGNDADHTEIYRYLKRAAGREE